MEHQVIVRHTVLSEAVIPSIGGTKTLSNGLTVTAEVLARYGRRQRELSVKLTGEPAALLQWILDNQWCDTLSVACRVVGNATPVTEVAGELPPLRKVMMINCDTQFKRATREGTLRRVFKAGTTVLTHGETADGDVSISNTQWTAIVPRAWLEVPSAGH